VVPAVPAPAVGGVVGVAVAAPAAAGAPAAVSYCWVCAEDGGGRSRDDVVVHEPGALPAGHVVLGDMALVPALQVELVLALSRGSQSRMPPT
jgi:hypothetical protein